MSVSKDQRRRARVAEKRARLAALQQKKDKKRQEEARRRRLACISSGFNKDAFQKKEDIAGGISTAVVPTASRQSAKTAKATGFNRSAFQDTTAQKSSGPVLDQQQDGFNRTAFQDTSTK